MLQWLLFTLHCILGRRYLCSLNELISQPSLLFHRIIFDQIFQVWDFPAEMLLAWLATCRFVHIVKNGDSHEDLLSLFETGAKSREIYSWISTSAREAVQLRSFRWLDFLFEQYSIPTICCSMGGAVSWMAHLQLPAFIWLSTFGSRYIFYANNIPFHQFTASRMDGAVSSMAHS